MLSNDELRALADVLESDGWKRLADYLRACADAQPVAWLRPENRVEEECTARTRISIGERCPPIGTWRPLYTHPAPAVPQAEPIADSDADYWLRNRQAILDAIERAGFVLMSNASGFWLHPRGTTEAQIEARDALLDFISENGTASEGVQYYLDRYVRAALAAKDAPT